MRYPYLLFDADNTLYDFDKTQSNALEKAMLELHGSFEARHLVIYDRVNQAFWQAFERGEIDQTTLKEKRFIAYFEALELKLDATLMNKLYLKHLSQGHFLLAGAQELIEQLAQKHNLLIVTNGLKEVQRPRFNASSIVKYFEGIIVSDELGIAKPHTGIFDAAFEQLGKPKKEDVLMIGDSLSSDIQGGIHYGIDTCWFNPNAKTNKKGLRLTYEIQELNELLTIV